MIIARVYFVRRRVSFARAKAAARSAAARSAAARSAAAPVEAAVRPADPAAAAPLELDGAPISTEELQEAFRIADDHCLNVPGTYTYFKSVNDNLKWRVEITMKTEGLEPLPAQAQFVEKFTAKRVYLRPAASESLWVPSCDAAAEAVRAWSAARGRTLRPKGERLNVWRDVGLVREAGDGFARSFVTLNQLRMVARDMMAREAVRGVGGGGGGPSMMRMRSEILAREAATGRRDLQGRRKFNQAMHHRASGAAEEEMEGW